jgi:hypothetical protein
MTDTKKKLTPEERKERDDKFTRELAYAVSRIMKGNPESWEELFHRNIDLYNGGNKRKYSGENTWTLGMSMRRNQFKDPRWFSKKQIEKAKKLSLKEGARPTWIRATFCHPVKVKDKTGKPVLQNGKPVYYWVSGQRYFAVYNGDQVNGLKPLPEDGITEEAQADIRAAIAKYGYNIQVDEDAPMVYLDGKDIHVPTIEEGMDSNDILIQNEEILNIFFEEEDKKPGSIPEMDSFSREMATLMVLHGYSIPVTEEEKDRKKDYAEHMADIINANPERFGKAMMKASKLAKMLG